MSEATGSHRVTIAPLTSEQVDACAALVERSPLMARYRYGGEQAREHLAAASSGADGTGAELYGATGPWGASGQDELVGFSWVLPRGAFGRSAYLKLILVDPRCAGAGVGRALIAELEARHLQRAGVVLLCTADNHPAQAFYRRLGYREVGRIDGYVFPELDELMFFKNAS
jgi:ribosomal protein S18 acetylase RimI-like enzyme